MRKTRWSMVAVGGTMALLLTVGSAGAIPAFIGEVTLHGARLTSWDADESTSGCASGTGFSPVSDGSIGAGDNEMDDAFDGGLLVEIDGETFLDPDEIGQKAGESLSTGPVNLAGLRVRRTDRALAKSPTLRSLITLRNNSNSQKNVEVMWDSDLGSDGSEAPRRTASGDTTYALGDRWVISSDDPTTPSDPVLTFVLFGKGKVRSKTSEISTAPTGTGCMTVNFIAKVPKKSTRHLLLFTEMNRTHNASFNSARKFNKRGLNKALLRGIRPAIRGDILNWKL